MGELITGGVNRVDPGPKDIYDDLRGPFGTNRSAKVDLQVLPFDKPRPTQLVEERGKTPRLSRGPGANMPKR